MSHRQAAGLMVLVTLLWSIAGVVTRHLEATPRFEASFWRSLFNAITLYVLLTAVNCRKHGHLAWHTRFSGGWPLWVSGLCWAVMFTAFMLALTLTSVAGVLVTMAVGPLVTALFARLFLDQRLPGHTWIAILTAGFGIAWMFVPESTGTSTLLGSLVALAVPVAGAANWTILQHVAARRNDPAYSPPDMLSSILIGACISALVTLPVAWPMHAPLRDIGLLALLGSVQLAIPCLLVVRVSRILPASEIALLALLEVIFGVLWAWLGANETPTHPTLFGGALVMAALIGNETIGRRRAASSPNPANP